MVERTTDGHDLIVERLVGKRPADVGVDIDRQRRHHREVVAVLPLRTRRGAFRRRGGGERILGLRGFRGGDLGARDKAPSYKRDKRREPEDLDLRESGYEADRHEHHCAEQDGLRLREELVDDVLAERLVIDIAHARHDDARRDGDEQRRNLRDETVADREDAVLRDGPADLLAVHEHAHADAADDVDGGHDQPRDRIALDELHRAVHRAVELALLRELVAALLGGILIDRARAHVGVDGHLLAGHRVERESGRDLRDALRALGDHDELHDRDDEEDDGADDEVAAHDEVAERVDDLAGIRLEEDETRRRHVQGEPVQRREEQH